VKSRHIGLSILSLLSISGITDDPAGQGRVEPTPTQLPYAGSSELHAWSLIDVDTILSRHV
jgi:hypothetical protein